MTGGPKPSTVHCDTSNMFQFQLGVGSVRARCERFVRGVQESEQEVGPTRKGNPSAKATRKVKEIDQSYRSRDKFPQTIRVKDSMNPPHRMRPSQPLNTINPPRTSTRHLEVAENIQNHRALTGTTPATSTPTKTTICLQGPPEKERNPRYSPDRSNGLTTSADNTRLTVISTRSPPQSPSYGKRLRTRDTRNHVPLQ
eukprot:g40922.t1